MMQTPAVRAPLDTDLSMHGRFRAPIGVQLGTLASVALASFLLGVAAAHAYGQYARHVDCQRRQESVKGWLQVVDDASGELTREKTQHSRLQWWLDCCEGPGLRVLSLSPSSGRH